MKNTLEKWGYAYKYYRKMVEITGKPETPEEKLKEILIRKFNLDVQINTYAFAYFLCAFRDIDGFDSMPWKEREKQMQSRYQIDITERTLRSWCSRLIGSDVVRKSGELSYWKTEKIDGEKIRTPVEQDDPERKAYVQQKKAYLTTGREMAVEQGLSGKAAERYAWNHAYQELWCDFGCCYYSCKGLRFNAIAEDDVCEIYELVEEIAARVPDENK